MAITYEALNSTINIWWYCQCCVTSHYLWIQDNKLYAKLRKFATEADSIYAWLYIRTLYEYLTLYPQRLYIIEPLYLSEIFITLKILMLRRSDNFTYIMTCSSGKWSTLRKYAIHDIFKGAKECKADAVRSMLQFAASV